MSDKKTVAPRDVLRLDVSRKTIIETLCAKGHHSSACRQTVIEIFKRRDAHALLLTMDDMNIRGEQIYYASYACNNDFDRLSHRTFERDAKLADQVNGLTEQYGGDWKAIQGGGSLGARPRISE